MANYTYLIHPVATIAVQTRGPTSRIGVAWFDPRDPWEEDTGERIAWGRLRTLRRPGKDSASGLVTTFVADGLNTIRRAVACGRDRAYVRGCIRDLLAPAKWAIREYPFPPDEAPTDPAVPVDAPEVRSTFGALTASPELYDCLGRRLR